jgi:hypothetical protein
LNALIFDGNGKIVIESDSVYIEGTTSFKSLTPEDHIEYICKTKRKANVLCKYLNEFYYYDLRDGRIHDFHYKIEYDLWTSIFNMDIERLLEISNYIIYGTLKIVYENGVPAYVYISI